MLSKIKIPMLPSKLSPLYISVSPKRMDARWKFGESPISSTVAYFPQRRA